MRHPIDPKINCVFKALLGAELPAPITRVEVFNPYNERGFLGDKLSMVDVKVRGQDERLYRIEIQLAISETIRIMGEIEDVFEEQVGWLGAFAARDAAGTGGAA